MGMTNRPISLGATIVLVALASMGCGAERVQSSALPSGQPTAERMITLHVANGEGSGSPESQAVLFFADEVRRLSNGTVSVAPVEDEQSDLDNDNRVISGEIDMAITQARSWDELAVTTLQALQT